MAIKKGGIGAARFAANAHSRNFDFPQVIHNRPHPRWPARGQASSCPGRRDWGGDPGGMHPGQRTAAQSQSARRLCADCCEGATAAAEGTLPRQARRRLPRSDAQEPVHAFLRRARARLGVGGWCRLRTAQAGTCGPIPSLSGGCRLKSGRQCRVLRVCGVHDAAALD